MKRELTISFILILLFSVPVYASDFPGPLMSHKMVFMGDEIFMFGGMNETGSSSWTDYIQDDFYKFDSEWTKLENGPGPRFDHNMEATDDSIYVFGGVTPNGRTNDLWKYTDNWIEVNTDLLPPKRSSGGFVYDDLNNRLILFGGYGENDIKLDDTWAFYLDNSSWVELKPETHPSKRYGLSLVSDTNLDVAILFGGNDVDTGGKKNDLWIFDMTTDIWEELQISNPAPRYWHLAAHNSVDHEMVIFGGDVSTSGIMDDTWKFDYMVKTWVEITSSGPEPRDAGAMVFDGENWVLYGGYNDGGILNDMWSLQDDVWQMLGQESSDQETPLHAFSPTVGLAVLVLLRQFRKNR